MTGTAIITEEQMQAIQDLTGVDVSTASTDGETFTLVVRSPITDEAWLLYSDGSTDLLDEPS